MSELEGQFQKAAGELAAELAMMHGVLYNLILALRNTEHSSVQRVMLDAAFNKLKASQRRFKAKYADLVGGANPENN